MTDAATAKAGTDSTSNAAQGGQDGKGGKAQLDELLSRFAAETKTEPKTEPSPKKTDLEGKSEPKERLSAAEREEIVRDTEARSESRRQHNEDFNTLAKEVADDNGISLKRAQKLLAGEFTSDTDLMAAWVARTKNKSKWSEIREALKDEIAKDFDGVVTKKGGRSDRESVRASARVKTSAPPKGGFPDFAAMTQDAVDKWWRENSTD